MPIVSTVSGITTFVTFLQPLNASDLIVLTFVPIVRDVNDRLEKVLPIIVTLFPNMRLFIDCLLPSNMVSSVAFPSVMLGKSTSTVIFSNFVQLVNASFPMNFKVFGKFIVFKNVQSLKL